MYLNCVNILLKPLPIEVIENYFSEDPEILYLLLRILKRHLPSKEVEKMIIRNLGKMNTSLQAKYCFAEFINEMHENYEVSSNFRELLLANNLIVLLDN